MKENEIIQRADFAMADLANGGLLNAEQSDKFLRKIVDEPTLLRQARRVLMKRPEVEIHKIAINSRLLEAAKNSSTQNSGPFGIGSRAPSRKKPTTSKIVLNSSEVIAEIDLPYETIEDNIEGNGEIDGTAFEDTILALMAQQVALDLEELLISGDTSSGDAYLALQDGIMKRATSHILNNAGAGMSVDMFANAVKTLPTAFQRLLGAYRFFMHNNKEMDYRTSIAQRQTNLGDGVINGTVPTSVLGVAIEKAATMPVDSMFFTIPNNLIWGVHRDIRIEFDRDIRERVLQIVLTMRVGIQIEEEDMVVKITNVG